MNQMTVPGFLRLPAPRGRFFGLGAPYPTTVTSSAAALDAQLAAKGCCGCGDSSSALSLAVKAFKQSILTNPNDWGSNNNAPTVLGHNINVSDPACQIAFGSEFGGTLADLKTVLGGAMTYTGSYCAKADCTCINLGTNCAQPTPAPTPTPTPTPGPTPPKPLPTPIPVPTSPGPTPAPTAAPSSGMSTGMILAIAAGVLLLAGGGLYAYTHRQGAPAAAGHPALHGARPATHGRPALSRLRGRARPARRPALRARSRR